MKKYILLFFVSLTLYAKGQSKKIENEYSLTNEDRKNYTLDVIEPLNLLRDTVDHGLHYIVSNIAVKLSNRSSDTLKYWIMNCSWQDAFSVDNKDLSIFINSNCFKNNPNVQIVAPHSFHIFNLPVVRKNPTLRSNSFRISMYLQKYIDRKSMEIFFERTTPHALEDIKDYTIWSNNLSIIK